jgi:amino acid permease
VLIIVVIIIIVLIYLGVTGKFSSSNNNNNNNTGAANSKRSAVEGRAISTAFSHSKIVNVGQAYDETAAPMEKLSGVTSGKSIAGRIVVADVRRSDVTLTAPSRTDYNDVD